MGTSLIVTAPEKGDCKFQYWSDKEKDGAILSYSDKYRVVVTENVSLYAIYTEETQEIAKLPVINITKVYTSEENGNQVSFVITRDVPEGYTLVEHGAVYSKVANINLEEMYYGTEGTKSYTSNDKAACGNLICNIRVGTEEEELKIHMRGYVTVEDTEGNIKTIYSDVSSISYSDLNP